MLDKEIIPVQYTSIDSKLPVLIFQGGSHGNFLKRCLDIASGISPPYDIWGKNNGAHTDYTDSIIDAVHPSDRVSDTAAAIISVEVNDLYKQVWHTLFAAGEFNCDVLSTHNITELMQDRSKKSNHPLNQGGFARNLNQFDSNNDGVREYFKLILLGNTSGQMMEQAEYKKIINYEIDFPFSCFYNTDEFITNLKKMLIFLGYEYNYDITNIHHEFLRRKNKIIESEKMVHTAFQAYLQNLSYDMNNFYVYEQALFDCLIEKHFNIKLKTYYNDMYPTNTSEYTICEERN